MSRNNSIATESIDETTEDISPIEEMDQVVEPLIKRITLMALKLSAISAITVVTVLTVPVMGLAEQPEHQETEPVVVELSENPPGWLDRAKGTIANAAASVKGNAKSAWKGITNEDEKISRLKAQVAELSQRNANLKRELTEKNVKASVNHSLHLQCMKDAVSYMISIKPGDD